jgi:hypothetical protein
MGALSSVAYGPEAILVIPVLASLLAKDNFLPHVFGLRAGRVVTENSAEATG